MLSIVLRPQLFHAAFRRMSASPSKKMKLSNSPKRVVVATYLPSEGREAIERYLSSRGDKVDIWYWTDEGKIPRDILLKQLGEKKGTDYALVSLRESVNKEFLDAAGEGLKVVSSFSVGYDHIDIDECKRRGITVGNTPGVLTETTADTAFALMMATARRIPEATNAVKNGEWADWRPEWMCGTDVYGSTVGIIGLGRIGTAFARRCAGFGCKILYSGRNRKIEVEEELKQRGCEVKFVTLSELLSSSQFVVPMVSLNEDTREMFNKDTFAAMRNDAILVNVTRGAVVNQEHLFDALSSGEIGAAGLDVTTPEPLPTDSPLLTLPNCVVLPHIGSASMATRQMMAKLAANNLIAALDGTDMPHTV